MPEAVPETAEMLHIWDDPESKIGFLETVMHGKSWRTDLHFPKDDVVRLRGMADIKRRLEAKGYEIEQIRHEDGHHILRLHHTHNPQDLARLFADYGMVTGTAHVIQKPLVAAKELIVDAGHRLKQAIDYVKDPARANGLIFLTSEAFITASSMGAKSGKWSDPKNLLLSVAGSLFLSQSATYLFLAKKGDERILDDFQQQFDKAKTTLGQTALPDLAKAEPLNKKQAHGLFGRALKFIEDHPIQVGAMANNLGMVAFLGAFAFERNYQKALIAEGTAVHSAEAISNAQNYLKKGFYFDIGGALSSIFAWTFMMLPPKETKEKSSNPIMRAWETMREEPQKVTSAMALGSSSMRLLGARERSNVLQTIGEAVYIPGDLMLWFTKNDEYGSSRKGSNAHLIESVANQINHLPLAISPQRLHDFVNQASSYIARQSAALSHAANTMPSEQEIQENAAAIAAELSQKVTHTASQRYDLMMGAAARLIERFDDADKVKVATALAATIPQLKGVAVDIEGVNRLLVAAVTTPHISKAALISHSPRVISEITQELTDLIFTVPGAYADHNAALLYDALAPVLKSHPAAKEVLHAAMTHAAEAAHGLDHTPALASQEASHETPASSVDTAHLAAERMQPQQGLQL